MSDMCSAKGGFPKLYQNRYIEEQIWLIYWTNLLDLFTGLYVVHTGLYVVHLICLLDYEVHK